MDGVSLEDLARVQASILEHFGVFAEEFESFFEVRAVSSNAAGRPVVAGSAAALVAVALGAVIMGWIMRP